MVEIADESSSEFGDEPSACQTSSRKTTPRNNSTITMARRGSPEESGTRSFIEPTVTSTGTQPAKAGRVSGHLEAKASRGPRLLPTGAQPPQPLYQHRVGGQRLGPIHQRIEHLVVARRRHGEQLFDGFFLDTGKLPPLTFERQDVVLAPGQPIGDLGVVPDRIARAMALSISLSPGPFRRILNVYE